MSVPLGAVIGALLAYALLGRAWMFLLGGVVIGHLVYWLITPAVWVEPPPDWGNSAGPDVRTELRAILSNAMLVGLLWCLPRQREALLRAANLTEDATPTRASLLPQALLVASVAIAITLSGIIGRAEYNWAADFNASAPQRYSPSLRNGWDLVKRARDSSNADPSNRARPGTPPPPAVERLHNTLTLAEVAKEVAAGRRSGVENPDAALKAQTELFTQVATCDYLATEGWKSSPSDNGPLVGMREAARWYASRARVRALDGDWRGSLDDIQLIFRFSSMETDDGLILPMVVAAIRGIGSRAGGIYWQAFHDNPEAMEAFEAMLDRHAVGNLRPFPIDTLRRREAGFRPIVLFADLLVYERGILIYHREMGNYELLRLVAALERHRRVQGTYPKSLDELVPDYLPNAPVDPFEGKPWYYEVGDEAIILDSERHRALPESDNSSHYLTGTLAFPFHRVDGQ